MSDNMRPRREWLTVAIALALLAIFVGGLFYPLYAGRFDDSEDKSRRCEGNMHTLAVAMSMYAQDYDDACPRAASWVEDLGAYIDRRGLNRSSAGSPFRCPADTSGARSSYGMNIKAGSKSEEKLREQGVRFVLLFETANPGDNPYGGPESVLGKSRHRMSTRDGPGIGMESPANRKAGKFFVFAGQWQPTYVLDEQKVGGDLPKRFLPGSAETAFSW